jgi:hypothetical protein
LLRADVLCPIKEKVTRVANNKVGNRKNPEIWKSTDKKNK